jgi:hypothetical protein
VYRRSPSGRYLFTGLFLEGLAGSLSADEAMLNSYSSSILAVFLALRSIVRIKKRRNALALAPFHAPVGFNPFSPEGRISFLHFMKILPVINLRWHTFIMPFTGVYKRGLADLRPGYLYIRYILKLKMNLFQLVGLPGLEPGTDRL